MATVENPAAKGVSPLAGKPATKDMLIDVGKLEREYFDRRPDVNDPNQLVSFGTSGHRGSPFQATFTEAHILAITQAICEYRHGQGIDGPPLYGQRHARHLRPRATHGAGSSSRQQRGDHHSAR
jgi:Phosphoglucomutase